tara:strand:- start:24119 stop:24982 length:864 start_codon:yes stop_codon:yes gene_type:complete
MDPYSILGINENATDSEIKKAYYNLAKKHHPDRNPNDKYNDNKFKEINQAYYLLINKKYKKESGFKLDDLFSQFNTFDFSALSKKLYNEAAQFSKFFKEKHPNGLTEVRPKTDDKIYNLNIDIKDIYYGAVKELYVTRKRKCRKCMGLGIKLFQNDKSSINTCVKCDGKKYIDNDIKLDIDSSEKKMIFHGESNESMDKLTGDIILNINPRFDDYETLYILNNFDLLYQLFINKEDKLPNEILLFDEIIELKGTKINIMNKIENRGLIKESIDNRGDLYLQIIYHNI